MNLENVKLTQNQKLDEMLRLFYASIRKTDGEMMKKKFSKGLGAIRVKIGPTSDVDKISPKCIHNMCFSEINTVS